MTRAIAKREAPAPLDIERARDLIAKATSVDELVDMRSKAKAVEVYQRHQRAGLEAAALASCIAVEAERRIGELLAVTPKAKGGAAKGVGRRGKNAVTTEDRIPETIAELGITKNESSRFQKLAAIPEKAFKETVEAHRVTKKPVTARVVIATHAVPKAPRPNKEAAVGVTEDQTPPPPEPTPEKLAEVDIFLVIDCVKRAFAGLPDDPHRRVLAFALNELALPHGTPEALRAEHDRATGAGGYVEARPGVSMPETDFWSRWTPRHVFTLHHVPGTSAGSPPLCVRRRVMSDMDTRGQRIELARHEVGLDLDKLEKTGRSRTYGSLDDGCPRWDQPPVKEAALEPVVEVFDHLPTPDERAAWLERHARVQAFVVHPPDRLWVRRAGRSPGAPDVAVSCAFERNIGRLGDARRFEMDVRLPEWQPPPTDGRSYIVTNVLHVDLYDLIDGSDRAGCVTIEPPTKEELARAGAARKRKDEEKARSEAEARSLFEGLFGRAASTPALAQPPHVDDAFRALGLQPGAKKADVKRVFRARARSEHPDVGGAADAFAKLTNAYQVALGHAERTDQKAKTSSTGQGARGL